MSEKQRLSAGLPICVRKDEFSDGKRTERLRYDGYRPNSRSIRRPLWRASDDACIFTHYHCHEGVEILRILRGEANVILGQSVLAAREGDVIFFNPFEPHAILLDHPSTIFARTCLIFQPHTLFPPESPSSDFLSGLKGICFVNRVPANHPAAAELAACVDRAADAFARGERGWEISVYAELMRLYAAVLRGGLQKEKSSGSAYQSEFMARVDAYLEAHVAEDITTADVAASCQYTTEHFCRLFRRCFDRTFKDYLNIYRIRRVKSDMDAGDPATVAELSSRYGFNNQNHFSNMFRKYVGVLPSEYLTESRPADAAPTEEPPFEEDVSPDAAVDPPKTKGRGKE